MRKGTPHIWLRRALCAAVILLLCGSCGQCCGPGRGGGRRRSPRRLTPLVFKQHEPNVAENTLGASGLTEGKITRGDPRFNELVPNYNKDILFSDEEGTGADRLMTERCKEKLNSLAISVMNQWPGVRLRVTEAWDEGSLHAPNSLHYEGRAVDITTSDKDYSKHGMLARLAVLAGFDWVYYETRSRVHCSVKSESSSMRKLGGCFPGEAQVETPQGRVPVRTLQQGTLVKVLRSDGSLAYSPVLMFLHKDETFVRSFLTLTTENSISITLTPSHLVIVLRQENSAKELPTLDDAMHAGEAVLSGQVNAGDYLIVTDNENNVNLQRVIDITSSTLEGVFAPLTKEGTIVIDNVVASCYAVIDSQVIAHSAFLPVRIYYKLKDIILNVFYVHAVDSSKSNIKRINDDIENNSVHENINSTKSLTARSLTVRDHHIHWYPKMLYSIASWILPKHLVYS